MHHCVIPPVSSSKAERHRTTCKEFQDQRCHHFTNIVLTALIPEATPTICQELQDQHCHHIRPVARTTIIPQASNCHFCRIFTCLLWQNGLRSLLLGTKPLSRRSGLLLGKQTCSSKAETHLHNMPRASKPTMSPVQICFPHKIDPWGFKLSLLPQFDLFSAEI